MDDWNNAHAHSHDHGIALADLLHLSHAEHVHRELHLLSAMSQCWFLGWLVLCNNVCGYHAEAYIMYTYAYMHGMFTFWSGIFSLKALWQLVLSQGKSLTKVYSRLPVLCTFYITWQGSCVPDISDFTLYLLILAIAMQMERRLDKNWHI